MEAKRENERHQVQHLIDLWRTRRCDLPQNLQQRTTSLVSKVAEFTAPIVAFSGGVDSSVIGGLITIARQEPAVLLTAIGPALAGRQHKFATEVAEYLGAKHHFIDAGEIESVDYRRNDKHRCFYCKSRLYSAVQHFVSTRAGHTLVNGSNADDLGDYRPGLVAAENFRVQSPLAEFGINKNEVRLLASAMKLPVAQLPAAPCLASRIEYGVEVNQNRLQMIEQAEQFLWSLDFSDVRVRLMSGEVASVEVPLSEVARLQSIEILPSVRQQLALFGFSAVKVQRQGLESGRLNAGIVNLSSHRPNVDKKHRN